MRLTLFAEVITISFITTYLILQVTVVQDVCHQDLYNEIFFIQPKLRSLIYKINVYSCCDHIISIVGWGYDQSLKKQYWNVRNSWGEYWGELGYIRVVLGDNQLGLEADCAWAKPGTWTEYNLPCNEDGSNC